MESLKRASQSLLLWPSLASTSRTKLKLVKNDVYFVTDLLTDRDHSVQLQSIGSYETKTHLADLLRRVRDGQGFTITQRGEPVADLLPAGSSVRRAGKLAAAGMRALMLEAPPLETVDIKTLIEAGRD